MSASAPPPWHARPEWTAGRIAGTTPREARVAWAFALFWNLISAPLLVIVPKQYEQQPLVLLALLFPLTGVWLLWRAVQLTARRQRFGPLTLTLGTLPASPGASLRGRIEGAHPAGLADVTIRLTCLNRRVDSDGDRWERILWREELKAPLVASADGMTSWVDVNIPIPLDALETTAVTNDAGIFWVLTVDAPMRGVNLHELFEVPVYRTGTAAEAPGQRIASLHQAPISEQDLEREGVRIAPVTGGSVYRFAPARNQSLAWGTSAFLAVWSGALAVQYAIGVPFVFKAATWAVEALLAAIVVDLWLGTTVLTIAEGRVRRRYSVLGLGSERAWPSDEFRAVELHIATETQGPTGTPYYDLRATLRSGRHVTLGARVRDKRQAEWLARRLGGDIGLRDTR